MTEGNLETLAKCSRRTILITNFLTGNPCPGEYHIDCKKGKVVVRIGEGGDVLDLQRISYSFQS